MVSNRIFRLAFGKKGVSALSAPSSTQPRASARSPALSLANLAPKSLYLLCNNRAPSRRWKNGGNLLQSTATGICPEHCYKHDHGGNMAI